MTTLDTLISKNAGFGNVIKTIQSGGAYIDPKGRVLSTTELKPLPTYYAGSSVFVGGGGKAYSYDENGSIIEVPREPLEIYKFDATGDGKFTIPKLRNEKEGGYFGDITLNAIKSGSGYTVENTDKSATGKYYQPLKGTDFSDRQWVGMSRGLSNINTAVQSGEATVDIKKSKEISDDGQGNQTSKEYYALRDGSGREVGALFDVPGREDIKYADVGNETAGGGHYVFLQTDPKTGRVAPIQDFEKQVTYRESQGKKFWDVQNKIVRDFAPYAAVIFGAPLAAELGGGLAGAAASSAIFQTAAGVPIEKMAENIAKNTITGGLLGAGGVDIAGSAGGGLTGQLAQNTVAGLIGGKNLEESAIGAVKSIGINSLTSSSNPLNSGVTVPTEEQALLGQQDLQSQLAPYESTIPANTTAFDTTTDFPDVSGFDIPLPTPQTPITGSTGENMATYDDPTGGAGQYYGTEDDFYNQLYNYQGTPIDYATDPTGMMNSSNTQFYDDPTGGAGGLGTNQNPSMYGNLTVGQLQRLLGAGGGGARQPATQSALQRLLGGVTGRQPSLQLGGAAGQLGNLLGGAVSGVGGILAGQTAAKASEEQARMISEATGRAVPGSQFRPIGTTTRFGTSQFQVDPTTGQLTSAGYQLTPELKAMQDRVMALTGQGLTEAEQAAGRYAPLTAGAQGLFGLGQQYLGTQQGAPIGQMAQQYMQSQAGQPLTNLGLGYLAKSPEEAASEYMRSQMDLLAPSRERQLSQLQNQLFNTGRGGLSVGATGVRPGGGQGLRAASPEMEAYYNALAQQDAQLAAGAQQAGQQRAQFGAGLYQQGTGLTQAQQLAGAGLYGQGVGLTQQGQQFGAGLLGSGANLLGAYGQGLTGAYAPFSTGIGVGSQLEQLGQQPLSISQQLAQLSSASGARAGELGIRGTAAAAAARLPSMQYNPLSRALVGAGGNTQFGGALGEFIGGALPGLFGTGTTINPLRTDEFGIQPDALFPDWQQNPPSNIPIGISYDENYGLGKYARS